jgi:hypothetical protein
MHIVNYLYAHLGKAAVVENFACCADQIADKIQVLQYY